jgi:hypothetical protein
MKQLDSLIPTVRKFFEPFPRIPSNLLKPVVPFLAWYVLLQGFIQLTGGVRGVISSLNYGRLPRMFTNLLDIHPTFFLIGGLLTAVAGVLYLMAFPKLSEKTNRYQGWRQWVLAALALTVTRLYEIFFTNGSAFIFLVSTLLGWYLIFEFERIIQQQAAVKKSKPKRKSKPKKNSKKS